MKKIVFFALVSSFLMSGCTTNKNETNASLSTTEAAQIWHKKREKPFGTYDYKDLETDEEAIALLEDKFQLALPTFYKEAKQLLEKTLIDKENQEQSGERYDLFVNDVTVTFLTTYQCQQAGEPSFEATIELKYLFDSGKKRVQLDTQTLLIRNVSQTDSTLLLDKIPIFVEKSTDLLKIGDVTNGLEEYQQQYETNKGNLSQQTVVVWENAKEAAAKKSVLKSIQLYFDTESVAREFYCNISDRTD